MRTIRGYLREIIVVAISSFFLVGIQAGLFRNLQAGGLVYFTTFGNYSRALGLNLFFILLFVIVPTFRNYREIFLFTQVFVLGYLGAEIAYGLFHWKLSLIYPESPHIISLYHLDYFFIHRAYQIIPFAIMLTVFLTYPPGYFARYLRFGNLKAKSTLIGKHLDTWQKICIFFLSILFLVVAGFKILTELVPTLSFSAKSRAFSVEWVLLFSVLLYAFATALLEEGFFRGLFLPVFSRSLGERGNSYQAFLFGGIHFDVGHPGISLVKLIIFSFLGWLWGRAARETGGIGTGIILHFATILALEVRIYFFS